MSNNIHVSSLHISTGYGPCTRLRSPLDFRNKLLQILRSICRMWKDLILNNGLLRDHPYSHHTRTKMSTTMCINCWQSLLYKAWKLLLLLNYQVMNSSTQQTGSFGMKGCILCYNYVRSTNTHRVKSRGPTHSLILKVQETGQRTTTTQNTC